MEICKIVDNLALEESVNIVDNDFLASIDDLDKAEVEVAEGFVEWHVVLYPALKVLYGICAIPTNIIGGRNLDIADVGVDNIRVVTNGLDEH